MERRNSERYDINVDANIIYNDVIVLGVIENFSDDGLGVRCVSNEGLNPVEIGDIIKVEFKIFYENLVCFPCEVRWKKEFNDSVQGSILRIGMEHLKAEDNTPMICR
ncbi:MAG: PilZ domain-containing protein [Thermodesulfovibrionia bacterium]|nr:PilZ domain-containing protein [Thermodesulfovibrionia bacterium]